jgi:DNA-directed RNA polymerase beta' subunit
MINFLDLKQFKKNLVPVTSAEIFSRPGEWHPDGLFSEKIFGPEESPDRKRNFSYIDLHAEVIHPSAMQLLIRLDKKNVSQIISTEESYSVDKDGKMIPDSDGVTGISGFKELLPKIKFRGGTDAREKFIKKIEESIKAERLFVDIVPVIPPELRPAYEGEGGRWIQDPLNDHYISILRKAVQMKSSPKTGPLFDLLNYEMQKAVIEHDNFIRTIVQKKSGLIRSQLMGKRTDFSGRAVITSGPELKVNEIGIPLRLAVRIFEPFLLHHLLYSGRVDQKTLADEIRKFTGLEMSVETVKAVFKAIHSDEKIPESLRKIIFNAAEVISMNRAVLAKRDPAIQQESVRGFKVKIVEGNTVKLCTLQVGGFNADFDGDTMAIYHPVTNEAQDEIKRKMMRTETGGTANAVTYSLSKEMCAGIYIITKDVRMTKSPIAVTREDLEKATDPYIPVVYKRKNTTMGKAIVNDAFPPDFPFIEKQLKKSDINNLIPQVISKYGEEVAIETFSKLKDIGFKFATIMSPTLTLDNAKMPDSIEQMKKQLEGASTEEADMLLTKMQDMMKDHLKGTGFYDLVESGSAKGWKQPRQMFVAKGLVSDAQGNVLPPIKGSFTTGLTNKEYFAQSAGARRGIIDRVINTGTTGYFARKLAYILASVEIDRQLKDCKTTRTLSVRLNSDLMGRMYGRYVLIDNKPELFRKEDYKAGDVISLRSPMFCESTKICHTCYGKLLDRHRSPYAGILAAQIIGEAGTQTIMRCSDGLVHYKENLVPFVDLFEMGQNYRNENDIEIVDLNDSIKGKDGLVKATTIQRHEPYDSLLFIKTESGHSFVCQKNHPLWIKKNNIHAKYENRFCSLIGDEEYIEYKSTRIPFKTEDNELSEIFASELKKYDSIWIDNTDAMFSESTVKPDISGYVAGIYCAEGCKSGEDRRIKQNLISQVTEGPIKERIFHECLTEYKNIENKEKVTQTKQGINIWDNSRRVNEIILGSYAWEKRLKYDFIKYDKQWLKEFLSGLIDGDGTVFTNSSTCCRIYTTSYYLVQQLNAICIKLGYSFNVCLAPYSEKYNRTRLSFNCDIRFFEDPYLPSEKIRIHNKFVPLKRRRNRTPVKGFDKIRLIKEIHPNAWRYSVYDIKTETSEYLLNGIQNHNTFHTGGAVKIIIKDVINDLINNDPLTSKEVVKRHLQQSENFIYAKKDLQLTFDLNDYPLRNDFQINDEETRISAKGMLARLESEESMFSVILDYPVILHIERMEKVGKIVKLYYKKDATVFETLLETDDTKKQIQYVERLVSGNEILKDADHLFRKFYRVYGPLRNTDIIHFEILLSQCLRDRTNPSLPARLGKKWDPIMINIKQIVFKTSFIQGLAFENINEAIKTGLIIDEPEEPSILEKILTGDLAEVRKK